MRLRDVKKFIEDHAGPSEAPVPTPTVATLQNGAVVLFDDAPRFYKDRDRVYFDGRVRTGSWKDGETLFILPEGHIPPTGKRLKSIIQDDSTSTDILGAAFYITGADGDVPGKVKVIGTAEHEYVDIFMNGLSFGLN